MPPFLHISKEDIDTAQKHTIYTVCFVGCGQKSAFLALAFAEAGFKVKCTDADQSITRRLSKGNFRLGSREAETNLKRFVRAEQITASSDVKATVAASDVVLIMVNARLDRKKCADSSEVESICKQVGAALPKGCLVIYGGVGGFGFTENVIKESLENTSGFKVGEDFGLAYVSFHKSVTQDTSMNDIDKVQVAANDKYSLNSAALIFEPIAKQGVKKISGIKTAELTALFAAAKRDSNIALANELAVFCESASVDYVEVLKLMENNMQEAFLPTISEEDNRNEAYILLENAENLNAKLRLPLLARQINEDMARHAVNLTQDALRCSGKPLRRAKVALLGSSLAPESASLAFVESLEAKGAKVSRYDPYSSESPDAEETRSSKKTLNEATEGTDCVVILSEQEQLRRLNLKKLHALMKSPAAFVDLASMFEPSKVEDAGFTYRGLGRGVWKK